MTEFRPKAYTKRARIFTGTGCNAKCRFCYYYLTGLKNFWPKELIMREIDIAKRAGMKAVDFSGGEPTIHPYFLELVEYAESKGFKVICTLTNGIKMSNGKFVKKLVDAGANDLLFSVHRHNSEEHDYITQIPKSFDKMMAAIRNDIRKMKIVRRFSRIVGLPILNQIVVSFLRDKSKRMLIRGCRYLNKFDSVEFPLFIGENVKIYGYKNIKVGKNVVIYDNVYLDAGKFIEIGDHTHIDVFTSIYGHGGVRIGKMCAIAAGVRIYSQTNSYDFDPKLPIIKQPIKYAEVVIGDDVWIGTNAVILPGVKIGNHSVIGAGAVVNKDIPEWSIAVGVPAKVIKRRCEI